MEKKILPPDFDDPQFDLPVENELLMLKLKAEFGAECRAGDGYIPPVVVNEFLKSVYEFEHRFREPVARVSVYEKIGRPSFVPAAELPAADIPGEMCRLMGILQAQCLELDVLGDYEPRTIYRFLTEEFFMHEVDDLDLPGYVHHFCYEEFHPNHEMDVRNRSIEMLTQWLDGKVNEYSWQLADTFVHPDSRVFPREKILERVRHFFERFVRVVHGKFNIKMIEVDWNDNRQMGRARVAGSMSYDAVRSDRVVEKYRGPFEFYLANEEDWWSIFYFVIPGFLWAS